jgi:hypothetical protein
MSRRTFTIGDKVRFKTERPPRIATVIEILEGGWRRLIRPPTDNWRLPLPNQFVGRFR